MPISLDDLRKTIKYNRKSNRRVIVPELLGSAEEIQLAQDFCDYFAELTKNQRTQVDFSEQYLTERAGGDFKLARGLISTLTRVYAWECDSFADRLPLPDWERLQNLGLENSSTLRLAMYDYVSDVSDGFSSDASRLETLELFGAGLGLAPEQVDELLFLDAEDKAHLRLRIRKDGQAFRVPTGHELIRDYNRLAVETLLYNSSEVIFSFTALPGTLLKKIGYLSKVLRIPYDLDLNVLGEVRLRLYGAAEAFGGPTKHGENLCALAFRTLSIARRTIEDEASRETIIPEFSGPRTTLFDKSNVINTPSTIKTNRTPNTIKKPLLNGAEAQVHLRDKICYLDLMDLLSAINLDNSIEAENAEPTAIKTSPKAIAETKATYTVNSSAPKKALPENDFDSSVEARFYYEFAALEREGQTAGWHLEREPEAIAVPAESLLFIPDFLLVRGKHRVFLEIIGFWTPAYRARKLEKLEKLKRNGDYQLLLGAAQELKPDFQQSPYPIIFYKNSLRPTDIIALLQKEYADFGERLSTAMAQRGSLHEQLDSELYIAETELYAALECYNKTELLNAIAKLELSTNYVEGYGLCKNAYLERASMLLQQKVLAEPRRQISIEQAAAVLQQSDLKFDLDRVEALLERLPKLKINRLSLFEVFLTTERLS